MLRVWPVQPPPPPACPEGFSPHAPGYWRNTNPCPDNVWTNCTEDRTNATVTACAHKCTTTPGCVAFELYLPSPAETHAIVDANAGDSNSACYIFLKQLQPPFTLTSEALTCVRHASKV